MAEIIYFGTNKCSGHYPLGIDKTLTVAEYEIWRECDNETWINNMRVKGHAKPEWIYNESRGRYQMNYRLN